MNLIRAVRNNDISKVRKLLATDKVDVCETDDDGRTPLICASYFGQKDIVELLLNHDNSPTHINYRDIFGCSALSNACERGHKEIVELLLKYDNSSKHTNRQNDAKWAALMMASRNNHKEIVQLLLNHDNFQEHVDQQDYTEWTALMYASRYGHKKIVEMLLEQDASVDILDEKGRSAVDVAKTEEIKGLLLNWEPKNVKRAKGA